MVVSCQQEPYLEMAKTSQETWDSINVPGVETIFYFGSPNKDNTFKEIYFPVQESLHSMGRKGLMAYTWALQNRKFDYVARVNASCYVNKKLLLEHVQTLPDKEVFAGLEVIDTIPWQWGGGQYIISRDVLEYVTTHQDDWNHDVMEDRGLSYMVNQMGIPYTKGHASSISKNDSDYSVLCYNANEGFNFTDWNELRKLDKQFFYRIKQDGQRHLEKEIMLNMFIALR